MIKCKGLALGLALILLGCSSSIRLRIKRAPEINLPKVQTFKIHQFTISGELDLDLVGSDESGALGTLVDLGVNAGANYMAQKKHKGILDEHHNALMEAVLKNGYFKVTEGGAFDATINGEMQYTVEDRGGEKQVKDKQGNVTKHYEIVRSAVVNLKFTITDRSGVMLGAAQVTGRAASKAQGKIRNEARGNLKKWEPLLRQAVAGTHEPLLRKIAPYFTWETRKFAKGKSKIIKKGNKAAKKLNWPYAVELWKQGLTTGKAKDRSAALFNLGIYDEVEGKLDGALKKYEAAYSISKDVNHLHAVSRVKGRIAEEARLERSAQEREEAQD